MDPSDHSLVRPGQDPSRIYTSEEEERLALQLQRMVIEVHGGTRRSDSATEALLCKFHGRLFAGVRGHAGIIRKHDFGSETLIYGPNRSVHRDEVPDQLDSVFREIRRSVVSFDANPDAADYEQKAIHLAIWAHAEIVRIHPFEDGNGRTSRLLLDWILVRVGLRPIAFEVVRQEYFDCLNHYYRTNDLQPLIDLAIRLYPDS